jgi:uncharacterized membrane protein YebE (DUF533 family)
LVGLGIALGSIALLRWQEYRTLKMQARGTTKIPQEKPAASPVVDAARSAIPNA